MLILSVVVVLCMCRYDTSRARGGDAESAGSLRAGETAAWREMSAGGCCGATSRAREGSEEEPIR
jgi:hypothetical protein